MTFKWRVLSALGKGELLGIGRESGRFPRIASGYDELTILRRQEGVSREDLLLAQHVSGRALDPGADEVRGRIESSTTHNARLIRSDTSAEEPTLQSAGLKWLSNSKFD